MQEPSAAQRRSAATKLGGILGEKPELDLGHVSPDSASAQRAQTACKVAQQCFAQKQQLDARNRNSLGPA